MALQDSALHPAHPNRDDGRIQYWGGLAGISGGVLFVVVFAIVAIFAWPEPAGPAGPIERFPEIRAARTVENGLYLVVLMLWVPLSLALYRSLRTTPALFGAALNILGLAVFAAGALPHVVTSGLADRYHAAGATADEHATLVQLWHATQGMFDALLLVGLPMMAAGVTLVGSAMRRDPAFGKLVGTTSVLLGAVGLVAATVMLIDPRSSAAALGMFALIGFHLVAGWKLYRRSRSS